MAGTVEKTVWEKIRDISSDDKTLIVLKGIPLTCAGLNHCHLEQMLAGKMAYFIKLVQSGRKIICYEEFITLYDYILAEYREINILENNLYLNFFPLYVDIDQNTLEGLLNHFDDELFGEDVIIGDIDEYIQIYSNVLMINGSPYCIFNDEQQQGKHEKVFRHLLFAVPDKSASQTELNYQAVSEEEIAGMPNFINLFDETDYISLVQRVLNQTEQVAVIDQGSSIDPMILKDLLKTMIQNFSKFTDIKLIKLLQKPSSAKFNPEFQRILEQHWHTDEFRSLSIYILKQLEAGQKVIGSVSQAQIISELVEEVEKCKQGKTFRDFFVTAPTGAGKSAMFQIPAIYLAEKYNLMTIVVSPLIGLMNDQVQNLEMKNYRFSRTINSDVSPILKQEILEDVAEKRCHILYISPETLLSRNDIEQLIGERTIGMVVIDEAHIVTTWGKQFRPDYWFLGDHIRRLRKTQNEKKGMSFAIAAFTATAIYGGIEDMYRETIQSLHMVLPITYLGYVKRDDIEIRIEEVKKITGRTEYEIQKFEQLVEQIKRAVIFRRKTLIYFPTVRLINSFYDYCFLKEIQKHVARYHGQMNKIEKKENYELFFNGIRSVMLATKAFGMGIDIDNIETIVHFAPTGNVCDYVQEIGRAARRKELQGEAYYQHMSNDFKHINRFHGLSAIQLYQLVEVAKKVYELYIYTVQKQKRGNLTKKRNEMLIDAESFSYIFDGPLSTPEDNINKVKTAMLIIQKDYENRLGFAPFMIRPIPLFSMGFFQLSQRDQKTLNELYGPVSKEVDTAEHICKIELSEIWRQHYQDKMSFPKFKYLLYTKDPELELPTEHNFIPALSYDIFFNDQYRKIFETSYGAFKEAMTTCVREDKFYYSEEIAKLYAAKANCTLYKASNICEILMAAMSIYKQSFCKKMTSSIFSAKPLQDGKVKYRFDSSVDEFLRWIERKMRFIESNLKDQKLYVVNDSKVDKCRELTMILGILEAFEVLTFKALGGANSQIYIYVNSTKYLRQIQNRPTSYKNRLLEMVGERHQISVAMLSFLFESNFDSRTIWNNLEDYFLGIIPPRVKAYCQKERYYF